MNSMTGYGRGSAENGRGIVTAELKSVNSRFLEMNMRSDHFSAFLEDRASRKIKETLHRGKVTVFLSFQPSAEGRNLKVVLDRNLLEAYAAALTEGRRMKGLKNRKPSISDLLTLPEPFLHVEKEVLSDEELAPLVDEAMEKALTELKDMRAREGANLKKDLEKRISFLKEKREFLLSRQDDAARAYEERLKERINKILEDRNLSMDEGRVLEEVALFQRRLTIRKKLCVLEATWTSSVISLKAMSLQAENLIFSSRKSTGKSIQPLQKPVTPKWLTVL